MYSILQRGLMSGLLSVAALLIAASGGPPAWADNPTGNANFTINSTVIAPNPPRFGFDLSAPDQGPDLAINSWLGDGGTSPLDIRNAFTTDNGSATTIVFMNSDLYNTITTGFMVGATARVYRFTGGAWTLLRTNTVTGYTAISGSTNPADHTITLNASGPTVQAGDVVWLTLDGIADVNPATVASRIGPGNPPRPVDTWQPSPADGTVTESHVTDTPPGDTFGFGNTGYSLKLTTAVSQQVSISQFTPVNQPGFEYYRAGHTYKVSVWLKQTGVASGQAGFNLGSLPVSTTWSGVTGTWQQFTYQFAAPAGISGNSPQPSVNFTYQGPGTLQLADMQLYDIASTPDTIDPQVMSAFQSFNPGTLRIWSNFSPANGTIWNGPLNAWLAPDIHSHAVWDYNWGRSLSQKLHLPSALAVCKQLNANPWLICNLSLSEQEWSNLIDYLAGPSTTTYGALRPSNHTQPYTSDFSTIYIEFGNEEWNSGNSGPWFGNFGQYAHYMLSKATANPNFNASKIKFILSSGGTPGRGSGYNVLAPEAGMEDIAPYITGYEDSFAGASGTAAARYQDTLLYTPWAAGPWIQSAVTQEQTYAQQGFPYGLGIYEGGPDYSGVLMGANVPWSAYDPYAHSLAAGTATLDSYLYAQSAGFGPECYFLFNAGSTSWGSHGPVASGFIPYPSWEALQMRNAYATGDMTSVTVNSTPTLNEPNVNTYPPGVGGDLPLVGCYSFKNGPTYSIFVLSRQYSNTTQVTLNLPYAPAGNATRYSMTAANPTVTNDSGLNIPISSASVAMTQNYTFSVTPGSITLFVVNVNEPAATAPAGLAAAPGNASVNLTWNSETQADHYNVKRSTVSGSGYATVGSPTTPYYADNGLTNGTTYFYVVTAVNGAGESANSAQVSSTPQNFLPAPKGLKASPGNNQVNLAWNTVSGATAYDVKRSTTHNGPYSHIANASANSYIDASAVNGVTYYYVVGSISGVGENQNAISNEALGTPLAPAAGEANAALASTAPVIDGNAGDAIWSSATSYSIAHYAIGTGPADSFKAAWDANNLYLLVPVTDSAPVSGSSGVDIYLDANNGKATGYTQSDWQYVFTYGSSTIQEYQGGAAGGNTTGIQFAQAGISGGYQFEIKIPWSTIGGCPVSSSAVGLDLAASYYDASHTRTAKVFWHSTTDSDWGNPSLFGTARMTGTVAAPAAPTGLTATAGNAQVALSWTASSGATSYNVLRSTVSGSGYVSVATGIAPTSYTNTGLTNGTTYYFVVTATNSGGTSGNSNQASATPTSGGSVLLSQGMPATASSFQGTGFEAALAVDGNTTTRWSSNTLGAPYWIYVDLGATKSITRVLLNWEGAYGKDYTIQTSPDASTWTTIQTVTGNATAGVHDYTGLSGSGRYVRVNCTAVGPWPNISLYEFQVYGTSGGSAPPAPANLTATPGNAQVALSWTASTGATSYNVKRSTVSGSGYATVASPTTTSYTNTGLTNGTTYYFVVTAVNASGESGNSNQASATPSGTSTLLSQGKAATASSTAGGFTTSAVDDGNLTTRWASGSGDPQWIYIDLGATKSITEVKLTWEAAYASSYQIQTSPDAITWTTIYSTTTGTGGTNDLTGLSGSGRYVRMNGTVRGQQQFSDYSLYEMQIYGF